MSEHHHASHIEVCYLCGLGRAEATDPIIRYAEMGDGTEDFDEFIARGCDIHLEAMGAAQWWLGVTTADGREWAINVGAVSSRAKGYGICEEDT